MEVSILIQFQASRLNTGLTVTSFCLQASACGQIPYLNSKWIPTVLLGHNSILMHVRLVGLPP